MKEKLDKLITYDEEKDEFSLLFSRPIVAIHTKKVIYYINRI